MSKNMCYNMYSKHKLTLTGISTAVFHGTMIMRVENN